MKIILPSFAEGKKTYFRFLYFCFVEVFLSFFFLVIIYRMNNCGYYTEREKGYSEEKNLSKGRETSAEKQEGNFFWIDGLILFFP
jgi:hypothetical protein